MYQDRNSKKMSLALAAALAAPLVHTASGSSWLAVAVVEGLVLLTLWCAGRYVDAPGRILRLFQSLWIVVLLSEILRWSGSYWPGHSNEKAAPIILLVLGLWAAWRGRTASTGLCAVLLWPVLLLILGVVLSSVPNIDTQNLNSGFQMESAQIIAVLVIVTGSRIENGKRHIRPISAMMLMAIAAAAAVNGVLTLKGSCGIAAPFYELSRSLSLFGAVERFESGAAAAMTIGYMVTISYLLSSVEGKRKMAVCAGGAGLLYVLDAEMESRVLAVGSIVFWIMLPAFAALKKILQKMQNKA